MKILSYILVQFSIFLGLIALILSCILFIPCLILLFIANMINREIVKYKIQGITEELKRRFK